MLDILATAKEVFNIESKAISELGNRLTDNFVHSVYLMLRAKGRVVVTGMGKSGHIGAKIAATLASTGTPSFFMHPAEALHGDLGMLTKDDVVLAISNSGESEEILRIIPVIHRREIPLIGMSGNASSTLAKVSTLFLSIEVAQEACPLQLTPTSSTTAALAMGDALSVALMKERNFKPEDFALFHPGGSLGRKLLTRVKDIMKTKDLPCVTASSNFQEIIQSMTSGRLGMCIVKNKDEVVGLITDGDLRRALEQSSRSRFEFTAEEIMSHSPKYISSKTMAVEAESYMMEHKINTLLVMDNEILCGVVQLYDLGLV